MIIVMMIIILIVCYDDGDRGNDGEIEWTAMQVFIYCR